MTTLLPKDADNNVIPALRISGAGAHQLASTGTAVSNTTAFDEETKVVSVYATAPIYIKFGENGVTATNTDHFFPANTYYDIAISGGAGKGAHGSLLWVISICLFFCGQSALPKMLDS